jgi:hypothetical protein
MSNSFEQNSEYDKGSISMEEAEAKAREGQDPRYILSKKAMNIKQFWDTIQKHLDEEDKCGHTLTQILLDIPMIQNAMNEF